MSKKKHKEQEIPTAVEVQNPVIVKLMEATSKGYDHVMIIGLGQNGNMEVSSTIDNTIPMHYVLNRAVFELNIFEMQNKKRMEEAKVGEGAAE